MKGSDFGLRIGVRKESSRELGDADRGSESQENSILIGTSLRHICQSGMFGGLVNLAVAAHKSHKKSAARKEAGVLEADFGATRWEE